MPKFNRISTVSLSIALGLAAGAAHADPRDEVIAAFRNAVEDTTYRMQIEADNKRGATRTQIDVQMPDRFHMKSDEVEFITIPGGTWINAGGRWMKVPVDMSKQIQGYQFDKMDDTLDAIKDVQSLGNETVNGCDSQLYSYEATSNFAGRSSNDALELAVCEATGKPIRLRSTPKGRGDPVTISYDFDADINIGPPN